MLSFSGSLRILIALEPCDMRAGFDRLQGLVAEKLKEDVKSGALFVFSNRRRTRLKIIYWDGTGLWLLTKRLEKGVYFWPRVSASGNTKMLLAPEAFVMLTDGIDMHGAKPRGWYEREQK